MDSISNHASTSRLNSGDNIFVISSGEENDDDSDDTLLDEEFEDQFIRPTPDFMFAPPQPTHHETDESATRLDSYSFAGRTFRPGKTVELVGGEFLRITAIVQSPEIQHVSLKGIKFKRNKELNGLLEFKRNEVTMLLTEDSNDTRDIYHQSVQGVQLDQVIRIRELIKTNVPFPTHSFRENDEKWKTQGKDYLMNNGRLVCRTKLVQVSKNEGWLQVLDQSETDEGFGMPPIYLRHDFRGETVKGGKSSAWLEGEKEFDEAEINQSRGIDPLGLHTRQNTSPQSRQQRYTFADAFCGAGGASRGAKAAGLRVDWGFDRDPTAMNSYSRNFFGTRCEVIEAHDFATVITEDFQVDILHLSPPCQPFSVFRVRAGKNDEQNEATFLAVEEIIRKVRPRIVTIEEVFGLTAQVSKVGWFNALIQVFTKLGFSVRWKVFNLCEYGLPQPRKRLFIFASW